MNTYLHSYSFWIGFYIVFSWSLFWSATWMILKKTMLSDPGKRAMLSMSIAPLKAKLKKPGPIFFIALLYLILAPALFPIIILALLYSFVSKPKRKILLNVEKTNPDESIEFQAPE